MGLSLWLAWTPSSLQAQAPEQAFTAQSLSQPQKQVPLSGIVQVAAGTDHTCTLTAAGGAKCWGNNDYGQLGDGTSGYNASKATPVQVIGLGSGVVAIAIGGRYSYFGGYNYYGSHTCALTAAGGVKCWGNNLTGQLGDGTSGSYASKAIPTDVIGLGSGVAAITAGGSHTCALTAVGGVMCWGDNGGGQLGDGSTTNKSTPVEVVGLGSGVIAIAAGFGHTCALTMGGGVMCWGSNSDGQLGNGTSGLEVRETTPVDVVGLDGGVAAIAAGGRHTCALTTAGEVKCWGRNSEGQLGDGSTAYKSTPVDVAGLASNVVAIAAAGNGHTCALSTAGGVKCWGNNSYGQLGDGTSGYEASKTTPVEVVGLTSGVAAIATSYLHSCALTTAGEVKCWGSNSYGQLGESSTKTTPVDVVGLGDGVATITAGGYDNYLSGTFGSHTCAVTATGGVTCWGSNGSGELGDGSTSGKTTPVDVVGLGSGVTAIAVGLHHTCALTNAGGVKCWGSNRYGQLGDGTSGFEVNKTTPVDVLGLGSNVVAIAAGGWHTCALNAAGGVMCWGSNYNGQLGDGSTADKSTPVAVVGLASGVAAIAAGIGTDSRRNYGSHTCALTTAGGVKCWGRNYEDQLGDGPWGDLRSTPVDVVGLDSSVAAIAAGGLHTCVLTNEGGVKCWGSNRYGQLGDGTTSGFYGGKTTPVDVVGLVSGVAAIATGFYHTCVLSTAGGVQCWGTNEHGQLGDGTAWRTTPVDVLVQIHQFFLTTVQR